MTDRMKRAIGLAFYGAAGLILAGACLRAILAWLGEIHFYWQAGWNFALANPGFDRRDPVAPREPDNLSRLLYGWPFRILLYGTMLAVPLGYIRRLLSPEPLPVDPRPLHRRPALWVALGLLAIGLAMLVTMAAMRGSLPHR